MTEKKQVYRCKICGNIVEVVHPGKGELVCCGESMELLPEKSDDGGFEKHVPVIEKTEEGVVVRVGSVPHPMEENHFIEWIELEADGFVTRKFLKPNEKPEAWFNVKIRDDSSLKARAYCNIHGLWANKQ